MKGNPQLASTHSALDDEAQDKIMNDPTQSDGPSLHDILVPREGSPYPVVYTSAKPSAVQAQTWPDVQHLDEFRTLALAVLQRTEGGGRVLAVADTQTENDLRRYVSRQTARLLAERGQNVLLVDVDLDAAGSEDEEGFIDLVLYGVSPRMACRPSPVTGIMEMSVGSFVPSPEEAFEETKVRHALAQLRATFDAVILVVPALPDGENYHPLLVHVDGLVLTTHLHAPTSEPLEGLMAYLKGLALPVWGVAAFTGARESVDVAVDDAFDGAPSVPEPELATAATGQHDVEAEAVPPRVRRTGFDDDEESSNPRFRWISMGAVALLVVFAGWFAYQQFFKSDSASRQIAGPVTPPSVADGNRAPSVETAVPTPPAGADALVDGAGDGAAGSPDEVANSDSGGGGTTEVAGPDETSDGDSTFQRDGTSDGDRATAAGRGDAPPVNPVEPNEDVDFAESGDNDVPELPTPTESVESEVLRLAKLAPGGGFALHVWSFPDSLEAVSQLPVLRRDGFEPVVIGANIPGRGRWFRVVVGRYPTRGDAQDARTLMSARADVDYVGVVRVR